MPVAAVRHATRALALSLVAATALAAQPPRPTPTIQPFSVVKQRGGAIVAGTYSCRQQYNAAGYTYKLVELVDAGTYAWRGSTRTVGAMRADAATGEIRFTSGPLGGAFHAVYGRRDDGQPVMILADTELEPKADAYDYCTRRADK